MQQNASGSLPEPLALVVQWNGGLMTAETAVACKPALVGVATVE